MELQPLQISGKPKDVISFWCVSNSGWHNLIQLLIQLVWAHNRDKWVCTMFFFFFFPAQTFFFHQLQPTIEKPGFKPVLYTLSTMFRVIVLLEGEPPSCGSLIHKVPLCGVYCLKWDYGEIPLSPMWIVPAPSVLSFLFLLKLCLMPSLPGLWSEVFSCQGYSGAMFFPFCYNGFNGALWDDQSLRYFLTQPWSRLLHNFVSDQFGKLLGLHVGCLRRGFRTGAFILIPCDRLCDTLSVHLSGWSGS